MPSSILNSDDGVISGTSGLKSSGGDDGVLNIQNNGTTAVTVAADGDVGIGTSSPAQKLHVSNGTTSSCRVRVENTEGYTDLIADNGAAIFGVSGTERMRIDASGRVTTPNQPAFLATRTGGAQTSIGNNTTCIFNTEVYDEGGNYNPSTGVFTAPVSGKYLFTAVTLFTDLTSGQEIDGKLTTSNRAYYAAPGRFEVSIGVTWSNDYIAYGYYQIADMDANDTAYVEVTSVSTGTISLHPGAEWSRFAGYLLG